MGWKGIAIGGYLGSLFGGPLGAIIGAVAGQKLEQYLARDGEAPVGSRPRYSAMGERERSLAFCASAAALLAKMAKADGVVTDSEIAAVERAFSRLGFSGQSRRYAIEVFRRAKDDGASAYAIARDFSAAVGSIELRELFYELLWDIAAADGEIGEAELQLLRRLPPSLAIRQTWYGYFSARYRARERGGEAASGSLSAAYTLLGASAADDEATLKRKYRELAKRNHPDVLRAQGLPEELVGKATARMSRINAAWAQIREARHI